jgi:hypothetical protein
LERALEPARTNIILPAFHERGLEFDRQHLLQNRNVFVKKLFLKIDRVGRDDRFLVLLEREQDRRDEIS